MTTTWNIEGLRVEKSFNGISEFVVEASWRCSVDSDLFDSTNGTISGVAVFNAPSNPFIQYKDIKESDVLNWCFKSGVDKEFIEQCVVNQVQNKMSVEVGSKQFPWS